MRQKLLMIISVILNRISALKRIAINRNLSVMPKRSTRRRVFAVGFALFMLAAAWFTWKRFHEVVIDTDVLVVGSGISGMSAAHEAGLRGARVTVVEMNSVFGGNAVLSEGGLFIVDTPLQLAEGYKDSPSLAAHDMLAWGEDADTAWVDLFTRTARVEIWDYLTSLGVRFTALRQQAGNHVRRFHENSGRGLGLLLPIYRECLRYPNISFRWNTRIDRLLNSGSGAVTGATGRDLRTDAPVRIHARTVILATGGFQGNELLVRQNWHVGWPQPARLLLGASTNSSGAGLLMGIEAGATTHRLDHQWHYPFGVPDPRFPGRNRAVSVRNLNAIWINSNGERFVNEWAASRYTVEAVVRQQPATYWMVFDATGVDDLRYSGTDWADLTLAKRLLVDDSSVTKTGNTWAELAHATGLPPAQLESTVARYNNLVRQGDDPDFHRFGPGALPDWLMVFTAPAPRIFSTPPYYAIQAFPMTRKNMGGLKIDLDCRVLDTNGQPIPGLFAAGEVAGLGGVNGKAGLEGTFLGPALVQGRRAGRTAVASVHSSSPRSLTVATPATQPPRFVCQTCHILPMVYFSSRTGYSHSGRAHKLARERDYSCAKCHAEVEFFKPWLHRISTLAKTESCSLCHLPLPPIQEVISGAQSFKSERK